MRSPCGIYIVAALATAYSLLTIEYSAGTGGQLWSGVFAALLLVGAVGLLRPWARFPIYAFSVAVVPTWVVYTIWFIRKAGWPYYATTLQSVLGLVPGGAPVCGLWHRLPGGAPLLSRGRAARARAVKL